MPVAFGDLYHQATKRPLSRFQWYDVVASVEMESSRQQIPSTHVDNLDETGNKRVPPNVVDMPPKSNKRSMRSESTSAVGPAAKRCKTERL